MKKNSHKFLKIFSFMALCAVFVFAFFNVFTVSTDPNKTGSYFDKTQLDRLAQKVETSKLEGNEEKVQIHLSYGDKIYSYEGKPMTNDTIVINDYDSHVCSTKLGGFKDFIEDIKAKIEYPAIEPKLSLNDKGEVVASAGNSGLEIDQETLLEGIDKALDKNLIISLAIPTKVVEPQFSTSELENNMSLRSSFSTSYKSSSDSRKTNVKLALSAFNGLVVMPNEEISFNAVTGARTAERGYKKANIILNGVYVEGVGGGVCQASTTLYNALIRSNLEILEVNKHTLPASYVPLAFDAMVAEGVSDLKFCNNLDYPILFKTWGDDCNVHVEIYGQKFANGEKVVPRAEFVRTIPHDGDKIVKDTAGEYSNMVMFKGEYYRVSYPREGYESKAYLDIYIDGKLSESKLIRHDIYKPQQGLIVEGTEDLGEGMTLPQNDVKIIPPQTKSEGDAPANEELEKANPSKYNP